MSKIIELGTGSTPYIRHTRRANNPDAEWILVERDQESAAGLENYLRLVYGIYKVEPPKFEVVQEDFARFLPTLPDASVDEILMVNFLGSPIRPGGTLLAPSHRVWTSDFRMTTLVTHSHRVLSPEGLVTIIEANTPAPVRPVLEMFVKGGFLVRTLDRDVTEYTDITNRDQFRLILAKS